MRNIYLNIEGVNFIYYDVHADKIKIVYTDWYHTEHTIINGIFIDKESIIKWSEH